MTKIIKNLFRQSFRWYFSVIAGLCVMYFTGGKFTNHAKSFYRLNKTSMKTLFLCAIVISIFLPMKVSKKMEVKAYMERINKI